MVSPQITASLPASYWYLRSKITPANSSLMYGLIQDPIVTNSSHDVYWRTLPGRNGWGRFNQWMQSGLGRCQDTFSGELGNKFPYIVKAIPAAILIHLEKLFLIFQLRMLTHPWLILTPFPARNSVKVTKCFTERGSGVLWMSLDYISLIYVVHICFSYVFIIYVINMYLYNPPFIYKEMYNKV